MARRSDHSREELTRLFLDSARRFAEREGLAGIGARRIARDVGYTPGTIYNIFDNLDGLIVHLRAAALDELYQRCAGIPLDAGPEENLRRLAAAYTGYVLEHPRLWNVVIEHRPPAGIPDWYREKVLGLMGLIERAIAPLFAPGEERARLHHARVLWACYHGIVSIQVTDVPSGGEATLAMTDSLIGNYIYALAHGRGRQPR